MHAVALRSFLNLAFLLSSTLGNLFTLSVGHYRCMHMSTCTLNTRGGGGGGGGGVEEEENVQTCICVLIRTASK